jgi:hypothetical protein
MRIAKSLSIFLAVAGSLVVACGTTTLTPSPAPTATATPVAATSAPASAPTASPASTGAPLPTAKPTPTPVPTTDGAGAEDVTGTQGFSRIVRGSVTNVGDVMQLRGNEVDTIDTMNDPRVTGTGTVRGNADLFGSVGPQWGTYRLENADGAWEGSFTGILTEAGAVSEVTAWLVGSGAYEGYTYYFHHLGSGTLKVDGIIYPGSAPPQ